MKWSSFIVSLLIFTAVIVGLADASAALPPETKKELVKLNRQLRPVAGLVRKKDVAAAKDVIQAVEEQLAKLKISDDERDRSLRALKAALNRARQAIPVSFESEIAPIIKDNCIRCHGESRSQANLRLDTFAGFRKGSRSGPLLVPRNPQNSHIIARLTADDDERMPRGRPR